MRTGILPSLHLALIFGLATVCAAQTAANATAFHPAPTTLTAQKVPVKPRVVHRVIYTNKRYGFSFYLPKSWKGYSVHSDRWTGSSVSDESREVHGPFILISHPLSTEENPREDIPIMVFTRVQWRDVSDSNLIVSAAPFPPSEIGRNEKYVFATPPRYLNDALDGWEEVGRIIGGHPLRGFPPSKNPGHRSAQTSVK